MKIADMFAELSLKKDKFDKGMKDAGMQPVTLQSAFRGLGGAIAAAFSVAAITAFMSEAMKAYDAQIKAETGLLMALKGRKDMQQILVNQANELQTTTLFDDDAIIQAQKMLAVMGLSVIQIKDLIPLIQDFSTATGMDMVQAANLVGKAIGTGANALGRYGVELDSTMSKTEKANSIMATFTERYGGQAAAAAKVGASGLQQLKKAWGEIMETIGTDMGPFVSALAKLLSNAYFKENKTAATGIEAYANLDKEKRAQVLEGLKKSVKGYQKLWEKAVKEDDKASRAHYSMQVDITKEAIENIEKLNKEGAATVVLTEEEKAAAIQKAQDAYNKQADSVRQLNQLQEDLNDTWADWFKMLKENPITKGVDPYESYRKLTESLGQPEEEGYVNDIPFDTEAIAGATTQVMQEYQNFISDMNDMTNQFVENFVGTMADGISDLLTGDMTLNDFFNSILSSIGSFLQQMGSALIAYGVGMEAFKKAFTNPWAAIAAGAALVVIGGVISNLAAKGPTESSSSTTGMSGGGQSSNSGVYGMGGGTYGYYNDKYNGAQLIATVDGQKLNIMLENAKRTSKRNGR